MDSVNILEGVIVKKSLKNIISNLFKILVNVKHFSRLAIRLYWRDKNQVKVIKTGADFRDNLKC